MQDPPLLRNIPPRSQHNFITFHWSVCLWFYITEPTLQNNFQSKVIHFVLKSSIFVNDGKSQKHNGISWFSKIAIFKKNVMSQMNTDGIRGFWLHALASLRIVHWSQEGKFSAQYRVPNNKMELSLRYWGLYDRIYGMTVCMIASIDHVDMLRVTNGASYPLSGWPLMGQKLGKIRHSPCTGEAWSQSAQCASQLGQSGVQSCRCFSILWCHRREMLVFGPKRACVWMYRVIQ